MNKIKGVNNDMKDTKKDSMNTVSTSSFPSTFVINGKSYYENKLLGEAGYGYVYEVSDSQGKK